MLASQRKSSHAEVARAEGPSGYQAEQLATLAPDSSATSGSSLVRDDSSTAHPLCGMYGLRSHGASSWMLRTTLTY